MNRDVEKALAELEDLSVGQLHERYAEVCGEQTRSRHRRYLIRRIAWRLQASAAGGLTQRALQRAAELAKDADVRVTPPRRGAKTLADDRSDRGGAVRVAVTTDPRLPPPGTAIMRQYQDRTITVTVLADGFEYLGERYRSLSAVAKVITGSHVNGFRFFRLKDAS